MANLTGENFDANITGQIKARQKVYGSSNRSSDQLRYMNANSAWIKLSSAVDIEASQAYKLASNPGSETAKNYVLFGGTALSSGNTLRKGLNQTYTVGGFSQGYRPMPGITSFETKNKNRGSLREGTINITCYNTEQFQIIDALYLRLGYGVLVEWGHSLYIDNEGKLQEFDDSDTLTSGFINGSYNKNPEKLRKAIRSKALSTYGNYDAFYAKVVNFSWEFKSDGTYNITISLISWGDVIETYKTNQPASDKQGSSSERTKAEKETEEELSEVEYEDEVIRKARNLNSISNLFFRAYQDFVFLNKTSQGTHGNGDPIYISTSAKSLGFEKNSDVIWFYEYTNIDEVRMYVRFGGLLHYLNTEGNIFTGGKDGQPLIKIDNDVDKNLIFTNSNVIPSDPRVCVINSVVDTTSQSFQLFPPLDEFKAEMEGVTVGKFMNVYFNMAWIIKAMLEVKDDKGNVSLFDFLKKFCEGINTTLGGLNQLEPVIDETENRIYFVDETVLPNRDQIIKKINPNAATETAKFEVWGYSKGNSSFIYDLGIKSEITPELAKMLTIGAQANGTAMGQDATAFSKWNEGLTDRVMPDKTDRTETNKETGDANAKIVEDYSNLEKEYSNVVTRLNDLKYDDFVDDFTEMLTGYLKQKQAFESISKKTASTTIGFIPLNINFSMVGLSGIKIFQKFSINSKFLPLNYPDTLDFLVKGISHKVDGNKWVTSIESLSIPASNVSSKPNNARVKFTTPPIDPTNPDLPAPSDPAASAANVSDAKSALSGITAGKCGTPEVSKDPPKQATDTVLQQTYNKRVEALQASYNATFSNGQYKSGRCARYTYNHAYNFAKALKGEKLSYGGGLAAGDNANQSGYWANLIKLGYKLYPVAKNVSKEKLINLINKELTYTFGDVLVYWANDNPSDSSASQYGHTQMWLGYPSKITEKQDPGKPPKGWTTDRFTNYGSTFVYNGSPYKCWNLLVFRAPVPGGTTQSEETVDQNASRKIFQDYVNNLEKVLTFKDLYGPKNEDGRFVPLIEKFSGFSNDDEEGAISRIKQLYGLKTGGGRWQNQLPLNKMSPEHQKLFKDQINIIFTNIISGTNSTPFYNPLASDPKKLDENSYITITTDF